VNWPCWLTDSGRFTHKVITWPAVSLALDRESSVARTPQDSSVLHLEIVSYLLAYLVCIVQVGAAIRPSRSSVLRRPQYADDHLATTERGPDEQPATVSSDETKPPDGPACQQISLPSAGHRDR